LLREFNESVEKLAWLVMASFVLLSSPMLFASPVVQPVLSILAAVIRAAAFVDKVLKGTKPANLPVEQPTKFEFIVNLKAAKQIGLTIPPNVLVRADRVIR